MRKRMRAALPYPHVTVPGVRALAEWEKLRGQGKGWPIIIGDDEQLDAIAEQFSIDDPAVFPLPAGSSFSYPPLRTPDDILKAAAAVKLPNARIDEGHPDPEIGDWPGPGEVSGSGLTVASDVLTGKPFDRVHILILPTSDSAEVPAYLRYGGWNDCPRPEEHVAVLRDWQKRYGAELIGINRDTMNLRVARRPQTRDEALVLAREQYRYCPDTIDQGVGTLSNLAAITMADDWWFFWWD